MSTRVASFTDALAVTLTMIAVLSVLDRTFDSRAYLLVGMAPVLLVLTLATALRRFEHGAWVYSVVCILAYAPLGALVALQRPGPYIFPTAETLGRVVGETVLAPLELVSTVPPVEASGTVLLVPYAVGFIAGSVAAWSAMATRTAVLPAVPMLVALAAVVYVGPMSPGYLMVRGTVLTILLVLWGGVRADRADDAVGRDNAGVAHYAAALLVVSVVGALAVALVPRQEQADRVLLRGSSVSQREIADASDPLSVVGERRVLMRTRGVPEEHPIRFATLDHYDGEAWVAAFESPDGSTNGVFRKIGSVIEPSGSGRAVKVRIKIREAYTSDWFPTVGELTEIDLDYTDGRTQITQLRYNQATSNLLVVGGVDPKDDYTFTALVNDVDLADNTGTRPPTSTQQQPFGAYLDDYLRPFNKPEVRPLSRVLLLADYLRTTGSVRVVGTSSQKPIDLGLRLLGADEIVATPHQYTALVALAASRMGVPARVVVGALPDRRGVVMTDDVTSWVEIQDEGGLWRILEPGRYVGTVPFVDRREQEKDDPDAFVERELELERLGPDPAISSEGSAESPEDRWLLALGVLGTLAALLVLGVLAVPLLKLLRRVRRRRAPVWSGVFVEGWQEVIDTARDRGTPVPDDAGRVAQARVLGAGIEIARWADKAVFAPAPASVQDQKEFWSSAMALRVQLLSDLSRRGRLRNALNPASLINGWERGKRTRSSVRNQVGHKDGGPRRQHSSRP